MGIQERRIGIIGAGNVGSHVAFALATQGEVDEILLNDLKIEKAAAGQWISRTRYPICRTMWKHALQRYRTWGVATFWSLPRGFAAKRSVATGCTRRDGEGNG